MLGSIPYSPTSRAEDVDGVGERHERERRARREHRDRGRQREHPADRALRAELLLEQQLPDVGHRLQRAERADAVRAVAVLEAAEDLALGEQHDRHELEHDGEDHQRLEQLDPPGLVVADLGEDGDHAPSSTPAPAGTRTGATETSGAGQPVRRLLGRALDEEHRAGRDRRAQPRGAAHAGAVLRDLDGVAVAHADALGVGRRRARRAGCGAQELQHGRVVDLLGRPQRAPGAEPQQRAVGRAGERGHGELGRLPRLGAQGGGGLGGRPADARGRRSRRA